MKEVKIKDNISFEDQIVQLKRGKEKLAGLYDPSAKASEKPDTGITIQNKSALYVIRDCATIAHDFIPLILYASISEPFEFFKNQFTKIQITDFVKKNSYASRLLLKNILYDIKSQIKLSQPPVLTDTKDQDETDDVYGDYGNDIKQEKNHVEVDISNQAATIQALVEAFDVKE